MGNDVKRTERAAEDKAVRERREFLKKAGRFGITAPMAALLLSVKSKRASAGQIYVVPIENGNGYTNGIGNMNN